VTIRNEFEQASIRIAEVDAQATTSSTPAWYWPCFDWNSAACQVLDGRLNGPIPQEAQVAVPRLNRSARDQGAGIDSRPVNIELLFAESVSPTTVRMGDELHPDNPLVKGIRSLPVRDVDDAVVKPRPAH
jgi:hypothetical protein